MWPKYHVLGIFLKFCPGILLIAYVYSPATSITWVLRRQPFTSASTFRSKGECPARHHLLFHHQHQQTSIPKRQQRQSTDCEPEKAKHGASGWHMQEASRKLAQRPARPKLAQNPQQPEWEHQAEFESARVTISIASAPGYKKRKILNARTQKLSIHNALGKITVGKHKGRSMIRCRFGFKHEPLISTA